MCTYIIINTFERTLCWAGRDKPVPLCGVHAKISTSPPPPSSTKRCGPTHYVEFLISHQFIMLILYPSHFNFRLFLFNSRICLLWNGILNGVLKVKISRLIISILRNITIEIKRFNVVYMPLLKWDEKSILLKILFYFCNKLF